MHRHPFAPLYAAAVIVVVMLVGYYAVYPVSTPHHTSPTAPDWTVAPCTLWAESPTPPAVPAYTLTDRCMDTDGTVIYTTHEH